jgi:hypothetical protein
VAAAAVPAALAAAVPLVTARVLLRLPLPELPPAQRLRRPPTHHAGYRPAASVVRSQPPVRRAGQRPVRRASGYWQFLLM